MKATGERAQVLGDRYFLDRLIGEGSFGHVWRATDQQTGSTVAIKILRADRVGHSDVLPRFEAEGLVLQTLVHENIARSFATSTSSPTPYIVMEYVAGTSLSEVLETRRRQNRPLDLDEVLAIAESIAAATNHAHEKGFVHRDLKPANVMRTTDGVIKLLDFGVAKLLFRDADRQTTVGRILGTVSNLSPEQARGLSVDPRADVFALSSMIFELFTLRHPWLRDEDGLCLRPSNERPPPAGNTIVDIIGRITSGPRPSASKLRADLPDAASEVLRRGMAVQPKDRPESTVDLVRELSAVMPNRVTETQAVLLTRVFDIGDGTATVPAAPERRMAPARVTRTRTWIAVGCGLIAVATVAAITYSTSTEERTIRPVEVVPPQPGATVRPSVAPRPAPDPSRPPAVGRKPRKTPTTKRRRAPPAEADAVTLAIRRARQQQGDPRSFEVLRSYLTRETNRLPKNDVRERITRCLVAAGFSRSLDELEVCASTLRKVRGR